MQRAARGRARDPIPTANRLPVTVAATAAVRAAGLLQRTGKPPRAADNFEHGRAHLPG